MTGERCIFWVQSLLGSGHLRRALTLGGALARDGLEVTVANGGPPAAFPIPPGVRLVQLPAVRSASVDFARLVTSDGEAGGAGGWRGGGGGGGGPPLGGGGAPRRGPPRSLSPAAVF